MAVLSSEDVNESSVQCLQSVKKTRKEQVALFKAYESTVGQSSERQVAEELGVPRTTLQHWRKRKESIGLSKEVVSFFESPAGNQFLHQLVTALLFVMVQLGGCGIRLVGVLLERIQLDRFVGCSTGSLHKLNAKMEEDIVAYGTTERGRLAKDMPSKKISMCGDETFHPAPCLVAIEPVSNFILTETYSEKRDAQSWSAAMQEGLKDLSVEIIQSASDEGKGLVKYVEKELGAHHSPDLFHVQQELTRATSAPLRAKIKQAEKTYEMSSKKRTVLEKMENSDRKRDNGYTTCSALMSQLIDAEIKEDVALARLNDLKKHQIDVQTAKKALGLVYHPYDLETGESQIAEVISKKLEENFIIIKSAADDAELSDNNISHLEKAHRVFSHMVNTIAFFWAMVAQQITSLGLSAGMESIMRDVLIPGFYLQIVAKKAKSSAECKRIAKLAKSLLAHLELCESWCALPGNMQEQIRAAALQCAQLFQRSSSCVEGRNGYLSLRHHGLHRLSTRKLTVLTVLHNFYIQRLDRTTAAERFFEQKPKDLFWYLLERIPYPARPAMKRIKVAA